MQKSSKLINFYAEYSAVVITGGSSGIGEAFLKALIALNSEIAIYNISRSGLSKEIPLQNVALDESCDIRNADLFLEALKKIREHIFVKLRGGKKVLLINNAGVASYGKFEEIPLKKTLEIASINICAPLIATNALLAEIKASKGSVINVASTAAFQPTPLMSVYGASKSFLLNWSIALEAELKESGCRVLALCPGPTKTNFFNRAQFDSAVLPDKFGPSPDAVALKGLESLMKGYPYKIVGKLNRLLIFLSGFVPLKASGRLAYKVMLKAKEKSGL